MIPGLPYDAEIEYLESTGTQWIDTGVVATSALEVDIRIYSPANAGNSKCPIGNFDNSTGVAYRSSLLINSNGYHYYYFGTRTDVSGRLIPFNQWIKFTLGLSVKWKGETSGEGTYTPPFSGAFSTSVSLALFCRHVNNNSSIYTDAAWRGKISHCAMSEGSSLLRDFIPVRVGQTGYMYDRVSKRLFGNKGTGSFVLGPDVAKPVMGLWGMRKFYNTTDYVQDGLVAMWDGIENLGKGKHTSTPTEWVPVIGKNSWGKGLNFKYDDTRHCFDTNKIGNNSALIFQFISPITPKSSSGCAIEFCASCDYASANYRTLCASTATDLQIGVSDCRIHAYGSGGYGYGTLGVFHTFTCSQVNVTVTGAKNYIDAVLKAQGSPPSGSTDTIKCPSQSANHVSGRLCSIRVYSRALTTDEILHNHLIDKARFNLP